MLWRRHEPAIDLALAEHGRSRSVLDRLWDRGGDEMGVVLAGNASLFVGDYLVSFEGRRGVIMDRILREGPSAQQGGNDILARNAGGREFAVASR